MMAIKTLLLGISHDQVAKLYDTTRRNLSRWVGRFNTSGIDGLIDRLRPSRPRKISPEKRVECGDLIWHPERADEAHWTGKKFHG